MGTLLNQFAELFAVEKARLWHGLSRSIIGAVLAMLAALAALEGLAIVMVGGYASLKQTMEPWEAGLIVGGAIILAAVILLAVIASVIRRQGQAPELPPPSHRIHHAGRYPEPAAATDASSLLKTAAAEMIGKVDIKARDIALGALVVGLVLGASPGLRRRVFGGHRAKVSRYSR
jgi:hypothetical protein